MRHWFVSAACLAVLSGAGARADLIVPTSVVVGGTFGGSPGVLTDGVIPPRGSFWSDSTVYWTANDGASIDIDLGAVHALGGLTMSVDNNDDYVVETSTDGATFTEAFRFLGSDGPVAPVPGGLEILTSLSSYPASPGDLTTPAYVGRTLPTISARYLRVTAANGDGYYSIGEIQVFSDPAAVPEPSSMAMLALGGLAVGLATRRSRRRS